MQTHIPPERLDDAAVAASAKAVRACVHCGLCTGTCPTYVLLGDERDSPRGRIYMMKALLESQGQPSPELVAHIDRCLSCFACTTTCPSGVDYPHLVEYTRQQIEQAGVRPLHKRLLRGFLASVLPYPSRFRRLLLALGPLLPMLRFVLPLLERLPFVGSSLGMLVRLSAPISPQSAPLQAGVYPALSPQRGRVLLLQACAPSVLAPHITRITQELLNRLGVEVEILNAESCCGAMALHMGRAEGRQQAATLVKQWLDVHKRAPVDAVVMTTSGCGGSIKDYGSLFSSNDELADPARTMASLAKDVSEYLLSLPLPAGIPPRALRVAYHNACSLQHGQKLPHVGKALLQKSGFQVVEPFESHLCCGSAGVYNIVEPDLGRALGQRKAHHLAALEADVLAAGNLGCLSQIGLYSSLPRVHTLELVAWAYGGDAPEGLRSV